jgi:hypothetical protein
VASAGEQRSQSTQSMDFFPYLWVYRAKINKKREKTNKNGKLNFFLKEFLETENHLK